MVIEKENPIYNESLLAAFFKKRIISYSLLVVPNMVPFCRQKENLITNKDFPYLKICKI